MTPSFVKNILFSLAFLSLISCGKKKEGNIEIPGGILKEELFTKVLTDFALAESAANLNIKNQDIQKADSVYAFDPLIENNVRKSQYDSSIIFYTTQPELYKKIYDNVLIALSEIESKRSSPIKDSTSK